LELLSLKLKLEVPLTQLPLLSLPLFPLVLLSLDLLPLHLLALQLLMMQLLLLGPSRHMTRHWRRLTLGRRGRRPRLEGMLDVAKLVGPIRDTPATTAAPAQASLVTLLVDEGQELVIVLRFWLKRRHCIVNASLDAHLHRPLETQMRTMVLLQIRVRITVGHVLGLGLGYIDGVGPLHQVLFAPTKSTGI